MRRTVGLAAAALGVALLGAAWPCAADGSAGGDYDVALVDEGQARHYLLHVPSQASLHPPIPVMVALHAGGSSAARFKRYAGLDRVADREGFILAYPEGLGRPLLSWNAGDCCGYASAHRVDDVGFIVHVLRDLARRLPVDRTRVYVTGHSNGAMMAYRVAAEIPERIAAIGAVAGAPALRSFAASRPVPILHIHSVDDARELYGEEFGPPFPISTPRAGEHPVEFELARWVDRDACRTEPRAVEHRVRLATAGQPAQTAMRLLYAPCATGAEVQLWKLTGVGHGWPGADSRFEPLLGPETELLDAAAEVWTFVRRFARLDAPPLDSR
jgi:polyhydroxybutyrate depolymerase